MRKLASIQIVKDITPIEGADKIELAHILGWQCVVGKGDLHPSDMVVYFEVDSFLPVRDEFEILRKNSYKENEYMGKGFKLRTMKFKGEISQGLCLPVSLFPEFKDKDVTEGEDVTEILNIKEWQIPERVSVSGTLKGKRPSYIPKTDETRIQSCPELLNEFKGLPYYITTKMDGSSHSLGVINDEVSFTGHNFEFKDDGSSAFAEYCKKYDFQNKIREYCKENNLQSLVLQGEWCAPGIQKNRLKLDRPEWFVFTVDINGKRVGLDKLKEICAYVGCNMVPVEETGNDLPSVYPTIEDLLKRAEGIGYNNTTREGIVIRPVEPIFSKTLGSSLSMKVINNKYLMKNED